MMIIYGIGIMNHDEERMSSGLVVPRELPGINLIPV